MMSSPEFPSVGLAYQIAIQSYETMAKRADALDGKSQTLMGSMITALVAVPVATKALELKPDFALIILSGALFVLAIGVATWSRLGGELVFISPQPFHDEWISKDAEAFQAVIWHLLVSHPRLKTAATKWEGSDAAGRLPRS